LNIVTENTALEREIAHYLQTGDYDPYYRAWPEGGMLVRAQKMEAVLRNALIKAVRKRTQDISPSSGTANLDQTTLTKSKIVPMVNGLFPESERSLVISILEKSVVFLIPENIECVLEEVPFLGTAWNLANLYLTSIGVPCLSEEAVQLEGLSEETTCFVSMRYFSQQDRFADFIVHEAAHVFHNCKRETTGLPHTRTREWLLEIDFGKRETFAYSCEAYSRILEMCSCRTQLKPLLADYAATSRTGDDRVDDDEIVDILEEAISAKNGWKRILKRCSPQRRTTFEPYKFQVLSE
jgi:hypothetical protein